MRKSLKTCRVAAAVAALALGLGAAGCGGNDQANANSTNSASNRNAVSVNTNASSNTISGAANSVANTAAAVTDTGLKNLVEANLTRYGVTGVTVEVSNNEVTLKGSIPRAKLPDAMKAANEASPRKVNNQLNLQ